MSCLKRKGLIFVANSVILLKFLKKLAHPSLNYQRPFAAELLTNDNAWHFVLTNDGLIYQLTNDSTLGFSPNNLLKIYWRYPDKIAKYRVSVYRLSPTAHVYIHLGFYFNKNFFVLLLDCSRCWSSDNNMNYSHNSTGVQCMAMANFFEEINFELKLVLKVTTAQK